MFVAVNVCKCHFELQYIPPVKRPRPPPQEDGDYQPIEIGTVALIRHIVFVELNIYGETCNQT